MQRTLNRMYLLLGLLYPWRDIAAVRWTLEHGDPRAARARREYLDNVLTGQVRKRIMPVLEDLPREEKVRRGNVMLRTRPRDVEETLLQLINDDDEVVAAAAIDLVASRSAGRSPKTSSTCSPIATSGTGIVFEAASWTLAERRLPADRRRELWLEPLPASSWPDASARCRSSPGERRRAVPASRAAAGRSGTSRARSCFRKASVPSTVHVVLDGRVRHRPSGGTACDRDAPGGARHRRSAARRAGQCQPSRHRRRRHAGD